MMLLLVAVKDVCVYINVLMLDHHKETFCVSIGYGHTNSFFVVILTCIAS